MTTELARAIIDANSYMTLATADDTGDPWASPVWFAHEQYKTFVWMSEPAARHSRNIAVRSSTAIVIFDSTIAPAVRNAVYIAAEAALVPDADLDPLVRVFATRSIARGLKTLEPDAVRGDAPFRLYRARATDMFVLEEEHDHRVPVTW